MKTENKKKKMAQKMKGSEMGACKHCGTISHTTSEHSKKNAPAWHKDSEMKKAQRTLRSHGKNEGEHMMLGKDEHNRS